jgi:hypothetical protein
MNPDASVVDFSCGTDEALELSSRLHGKLTLARQLAITLDSELANVIAGAATSASDLMYALPACPPLFTDSRAIEHVDYLGALVQRALDACRAVDDGLTRARCLAPGPGRIVVKPAVAADFRIRANGLVGSLTEGSGLALEVVHALEAARAQVIERSLAEQSVPLSKSRERPQTPRIAPLADRLAATTARLLPARDRDGSVKLTV